MAHPMAQFDPRRHIQRLIEHHRTFYDQHELKDHQKARNYYRGKFLSSDMSKSVDNRFVCTKNMVWAITDTARSQLLGDNPTALARPRRPGSEKGAQVASLLMEYLFDANNMRERNEVALTDGMLLGRAVYKTGWDEKADEPIVTTPHVHRVFFDLEARTEDEITYWLEATTVPLREFRQRVESGLYTVPEGSHINLTSDVRGNYLPQWMRTTRTSEASKKQAHFGNRVLVWEYYDRDRNMVVHYLPSHDVVLMKESLAGDEYIPYVLLQMNYNGEDCRGLSEVQLIIPQQDTINDMLTHWKRLVYLIIPRIMVNLGMIKDTDVNALVAASAGAFVGVTPANAGAMLDDIRKAFYEQPTPKMPQEFVQFLDRQEADAGYVSSLANITRAQIMNLRTATEGALLQAANRTKLSPRQANLDRANARVAAKMFWLAQRQMKIPKFIELSAGQGWQAVTLKSIRNVKASFKVTTYQPSKTNPAVMLETLLALLPILKESGEWDMRKVHEHISRLAALPSDALLPADLAVLRRAKDQIEQADPTMAARGPAEPPMLEGPPPPDGELDPALQQQLADALQGGVPA